MRELTFRFCAIIEISGLSDNPHPNMGPEKNPYLLLGSKAL
jgi:hypothetical protein